MKTAGINSEMAMDATNLTQLSSREQLSALMDGALPADETRFLLRRLQHDASLAESWERWRLSAEVMRGLAPAQRLPVDFASRVAAALRDEAGRDEVLLHEAARHGTIETSIAAGTRTMRPSAWRRWGGGAAVAASLAVVAFMNQPTVVGLPETATDTTTVANAPSPAPVPETPAPQTPARAPAGMDFESQTAALASAVAVVARPTRNNRRSSLTRDTQAASVQAASVLASTGPGQPVESGLASARTSSSTMVPLLPQTDIITRPWPRSVLPQYGNNAGLAVGFGNSAHSMAPYNPFQVRTGIGNLPPVVIVDTPAGAAATPENGASGRAAADEPQS